MKSRAKQIVTVLMTIALLLCLTACGSKSFECDICNEEKTGKSYKAEQMGEEITVCESCYNQLKELTGN